METHLSNAPLPGRKRRRKWTAGISSSWLGLGGVAAVWITCAVPAIAQSSVAVPRWGQSSALASSLFVIHGGRTEGTTGGGYTFTSGPNSADLLALDLSKSFTVGSGATAPWQVVSPANSSSAGSSSSNNDPPAVSFGTLSPLTSKRLLLFGGDGSPEVPVQTRNDSLYFIDLASSDASNATAGLAATWTKANASWSEPMRRVYASSESASDGRYWLVGGEKADGSNMLLPETWALGTSDARSSFTSLQPPMGSIAGQTSTLLSDGTLLLLGGQDSSGQLQSFQNVVAFDTKANAWKNITTTSAGSGGVPPSRRGHVAVSLPSQRVFVHGGSPDNAMSTALDDAWLLDWSQNPPRWTAIDTAAGAPSARFGHSAVAYGRKIVLTLGWTGSNPADTGVYVFDASSLNISKNGTITGGSWSATYSPDPDVDSGPSIGSGSSGSDSTNNANGDGSSTSSGGDSGSQGNGDTSGSDSHFGSDTPSAGTNDGGSGGGDDNGGGTSGAAKAGAVIGAFVAVGLAVAGGYAIYHRYEQHRLNNWRHGDGSHALLGVADMEAGGGYGNEKSYGQYQPGTRPAGPRSYGRSAGQGALAGAGVKGAHDGTERASAEAYELEMAHVSASHREPTMVPIWSPNAAGHAIEGPGPRMRDRLAMLTGFAAWAPQSQPRFDMLADEDEDEARDQRLHNLGRTASSRRPHGISRSSLDHEHLDLDDRELAAERHLRERSYGRVGTFESADPYYEEHDGQESIGSPHRFSADDPYVTSPFEDEQGTSMRPSGPRTYGSRSGGSLLAAAGAVLGLNATRRDRLDSDDGHSSSSGHVDSVMAHSVQSDQTHRSREQTSVHSVAEDSSLSSSARSAGNTSGRSNSTGGRGMVSFSDAQHSDSMRGGASRNKSASYYMMPLDGPRVSDATGSMRRSSTWWGRIMGNLERTSSGRFAGSPGAHAPIRDPASPPALNLSTIKESPRSVEPSEDNPFADVVQVQNSASSQSSLARHATVGIGGRGAYDELGRKRPRSQQWEELRDEHGAPAGIMASSRHGRSQSSLQSARTNASSHLEAQFRGMDVVQRTRTGSSRHTTSTRRTGSQNTSEPGSLSSRMGSLYETGLPQHLEEEETPGQVVWEPSNWQNALSPPSAGVPLPPMPETSDVDESMDIVEGAAADESQDQSETSFVYSPVEMEEVHSSNPFADRLRSTRRDDYFPDAPTSEFAALRHIRGSTIPREVSEVPSVTPATTKRARQNPMLIAPISPQPKRTREAPLTGTVKDRVKEIEKKRSADSSMPPPSPELLLTQSPSKRSRTVDDSRAPVPRQARATTMDTSAKTLGHGFPPSDSTSSLDTEAERERAVMSPIRIMSPVSARGGDGAAGQKKVQHGLVPRAQISIANPDEVD